MFTKSRKEERKQNKKLVEQAKNKIEELIEKK